jgi:hypothetical protein
VRAGVGLLLALLVLVPGRFDSLALAAGSNAPPFRAPAFGLFGRAPAGWYATDRPLVRLVAPRPVLAVASFSLAGLPAETGDCPHAALRRRGARGALLMLLEEREEHYLNRFPLRPRAFRLHPYASGCYGRRGQELTFRARGRAFYAFISLGAQAPPASVRLLEATLDSLGVGARRLHPLELTDRTGSFTVAYPALWSATRTRLDAIASPPQLAAVASYPLAVRPSKDSCPHSALARRPAGGVFIQLREEPNASVARRFPARPAHLQLPRLRTVECFGRRSAVIRFRTSGRGFYAYVSFGPRTSSSTRQQTLHVLDGLRISAR